MIWFIVSMSVGYLMVVIPYTWKITHEGEVVFWKTEVMVDMLPIIGSFIMFIAILKAVMP